MSERTGVTASRLTVVLATALAAASGGVDAICFAVLGQAFASVVTGNLVVVGLALGRRDPVEAAHAGVAVVAYAVGVAGGAAAVGRSDDASPRWPPRVIAAFTVEIVLLLVVAAVYGAHAGRPVGTAQYAALAVAAAAMGVQSSAFGAVAPSGVATTYLTGTLTGLFTRLVTDRRVHGPALLVLVGVIVGAALTGLLLVVAPRWAVALPVALLLAVVVTAVARSAGSRSGTAAG